MTLQLRLYSKPGCHLCDAALAALDRLRPRQPYALEVVDITTDPELLGRYGERIPVLSVNGSEYDAPLDERVLKQALRQTRTTHVNRTAHAQ